MVLNCLFYLVLLSVYSTLGYAQEANVCQTYLDYTTRIRCTYNPDVDSTTDEITKNHGYPSETHEVTTPDGYILTMFRIPNNSAEAQTIFIQHGANTDSTVWVDIGNRSLAFYLFELGYDVWMGNIRGSYYSQKHINRTGLAYWDFSLDQLTIYDMPTQLNYVKEHIRNKTNTKMIYIGHSMGTTLSYQYSAARPMEAQDNVCGFISLAPITFFDFSKFAAPMVKPMDDFLQFILGRFVFPIQPNRRFNQQFFKEVCFHHASTAKVCNDYLNFALGSNPLQRLPADVPLIFSYFASGISSRILSQFLQRRGQKFNYFDYGPLNVKHYGKIIPPPYDLKQINNRFLLLYGPADPISHKLDIDHFLNRVADRGMFEVAPVDNFNHLDFMYAKDIVPLLYEKMMPFITRAKATFCK